MKFKIEIGDGEIIPLGYGVAWLRWLQPGYVCFPIGFNLIFRIIREIYFVLTRPTRSGLEEIQYLNCRYGKRYRVTLTEIKDPDRR